MFVEKNVVEVYSTPSGSHIFNHYGLSINMQTLRVWGKSHLHWIMIFL